MNDIASFIRGLPKAELHMHLEGSIEPELMMAIGQRNGLTMRWDTADALRADYVFSGLAAFLALYYEACRVLVREQDFYDITRAYLRRANSDGIVRAEMFIGPQSFIERGVPLEDVMEGVLRAIEDARREDAISGGLLVSAQRHRSEAEALALLDAVVPWTDRIAGIGLGGAERDNPPAKFANFFRAAAERGFPTTVHAGEEGPAAYVREAVEILRVHRIDHGNACLDDRDLVRILVERQIPLTVCPLSNLALNGVASLDVHPLKQMLAAGLNVTVNSDDPPYFGGYVNENMIACHAALRLSVGDLVTLARNSICASFAPADEKERGLARLQAYIAQFSPRTPH